MTKFLRHFFRAGVILLTATSLPGCALLERQLGESCNSRAYVATDIESYLMSRFNSKSPVRVAVIPFTTPANLTPRDNVAPTMGNTMAWLVQSEFLRTETFPIVEVLNRQDWPGKKDEFFTGNFGAISSARDAGYDLALVGWIEPITRLDTLTVSTKLFDLDSGITLWYGRTGVVTNRKDMEAVGAFFGLNDERPDLLYSNTLVERAARCIVNDVLNESRG